MSSMKSGASRSSSQIICSCLISCSFSMPRRRRCESILAAAAEDTLGDLLLAHFHREEDDRAGSR